MMPDDAPRLRSAFQSLTPDEVRMRFLHPMRELTPEYAARLANPDPQREFALVLVEALHPAQARIGAVARATIDDSSHSAEFAIIVGRELRRQGIARHLLSRVIEWCRKKRLHQVYGFVLRENQAMLDLARALGFRLLHAATSDSIIEVRKILRPAPSE